MARESQAIDATNMPDVSRLVQEVNRTGRTRLIQVGGDVARLSPAQHAPEKRTTTKRRRRSGILRPDDTLFQLIGIGASGRSDVSANKHTYLAEAYRAKTT